MTRIGLLLSFLTLALAARRLSRFIAAVLAATMVLTSLSAVADDHAGSWADRFAVVAQMKDPPPAPEYHAGNRTHCHCAQASRVAAEFVPPARAVERAAFALSSEVAIPSFVPPPLPEPPRA